MKRVAALAAAAALGAAIAGAAPLPTPPIAPESGIAIAVASHFDPPPVSGGLTLDVTIRNDSRRDGTWRLTFEASRGWGGWSHDSVEVLRVPAGEMRRFALAVPLGTASDYPWVSVDYRIAGPGVAPESLSLYQRHVTPSGGAVSSPLALSESLAIAHESRLEADLSAAGNTLLASRFDPEHLPADWRGYAGFTRIAMTEAEHRRVSPEARGALRSWVAGGGELLLLTGSAGTDAEEATGFGRVVRRAVASGDEEAEALADAVWRPAPVSYGSGSYHAGALADGVAIPEPPGGGLAILVLVVAGVAGPLNLFWFCRGGRRARLFWTTPLVSVVASLAVLGVILATDGTGGSGARWTAIVLQEEQHAALVLQEQISRTGFLLGSAFELEGPVLLEPVESSQQYYSHAASPGRLRRDGTRYSGEWFESRTLRAHYLEATRPSRYRIERAAAGTDGLRLVSSIPATLDTFFWLDGSGAWWRAERVQVGVPFRLEPSDAGQFQAWRGSQSSVAGPRGRELMRALVPENGDFFASTVEGALGLDTLPAVEWHQAGVLITGEVL